MFSENSNINLNKLKYLKYKNNYLSLKKMTGGADDSSSDYKKELNRIKEAIVAVDKQKDDCMEKLKALKKEHSDDVSDCNTKLVDASDIDKATAAREARETRETAAASREAAAREARETAAAAKIRDETAAKVESFPFNNTWIPKVKETKVEDESVPFDNILQFNNIWSSSNPPKPKPKSNPKSNPNPMYNPMAF